MKHLLIIAAVFLQVVLLQSCGKKLEYADIVESHESNPPDHAAFTALLSKHVNDEGWVDYKGFINDADAFRAYLDSLSENPPSDFWSKEEQLAYWINVYNAFTIKVIMGDYPLESITDIKTFHIPLVNTIWQDKVIPIGDHQLSLDYVEHEILRKEFNEPRIHFAIVCASISCPKLRSEAFEAEMIDAQLQEQAAEFINDPSRNVITADQLELSKIFSWFKGDFTKEGSLIDYINQYTTTEVNENASVSFLSYDWGLNEQRQR